MIITEPNAVAAPILTGIHGAAWSDAWLDPRSRPDELMKMLRPADDDLLDIFPVTRDRLKIKAPDEPVLEPVAVH